MKFYVLNNFGFFEECGSLEEAEAVLGKEGEDAWICNDDDEGHGFGVEDEDDPSDDWDYEDDLSDECSCDLTGVCSGISCPYYFGCTH